MKHHIRINDMEDADLLSFLPPAVGFIEKEIEKGRGVLVHCLAGVSGCDIGRNL
jgi:dual specificity phosphatase 12